MKSPLGTPRLRTVLLTGAALVLAASLASAQSQSSATDPSGTNSANESSSASFTDQSVRSLLDLNAADPSAGGGGGAAHGQDYGGKGAKGYIGSHWAFEAGGGFNAPESSSVTYGGNFTVGGGLRLNKYLTGLIEYQFIDDKLPGYLIAETGANGGYAHIWSITFDPVIDLMPKATNDVYVTGGGGFYRKVTSFTDPEETEYCYYYYCGIGTENAVVGHFSSNQGGWNVGAGFQHRMGGTYGDSKTKLFVEARYLDVMSPASVSNPNGLGTTAVAADTKLIPVTVGVRF